jgi:N-acetylmuramoyl-L-alanine amidase
MNIIRPAIVIGHAKDSKGACSKWLPSEFDYNSKVAEELVKLNPSITVYKHDSYSMGYYAMESRTANRINKNDHDLVLELHYNSASSLANGTEACYWFGSKKGKEYALKISEGLSYAFKTTNRGVRPLVNKNDRGYWFTYLMKPPAVLIEPFFGSNEFDSLKFSNPIKYAYILNNIINIL